MTRTQPKPKLIYIAGKIADINYSDPLSGDFRNHIASFSPYASWDILAKNPSDLPLRPDPIRLTYGWDYSGPFFIRQHGIFIGPTTHGAIYRDAKDGYPEGMYGDEEDFEPLDVEFLGGLQSPFRKEVYDRNNFCLDRSDILWAHITAYDAIGTACEIQRAHLKGIPVYLTFAPGINPKEWWYAVQMAEHYWLDITEAKLPRVLDWIDTRRRYPLKNLAQ